MIIGCVSALFLSWKKYTKSLDEWKQLDMKPADQREQAGCGKEPKSRVLHMLVR